MLSKSEPIVPGNGRSPAGHPELDRVDLLLLGALQQNARSTYAELDARRVGYGLTAFVSAYCASDLDYDRFTVAVQAFHEIIEIHSVAGDETYLLKVVTRSTAHLDDFLTRLKRVPGVARTRTTIVLSTPFERGGLAVEALT